MMTETKTTHTPGPWTPSYDAENCIDGPEVAIFPESGGLAVCGVVCVNAHGLMTPRTEELARANARLIAAAPDMLKALEAARSWMDTTFDLEADDDTPCSEIINKRNNDLTYKQVLEAIRKTTS